MARKTKERTYLTNFFNEKDLPFAQWELTDKKGVNHIINNEVVIESLHKAPANEQVQICNMLRRIDFVNGDVNDYLKHLASALINL